MRLNLSSINDLVKNESFRLELAQFINVDRVELTQAQDLAVSAIGVNLDGYLYYFTDQPDRVLFFSNLGELNSVADYKKLLTHSLNRVLSANTSFVASDSAAFFEPSGRPTHLYIWTPFDQVNEAGWFEWSDWMAKLASFHEECSLLDERLEVVN